MEDTYIPLEEAAQDLGVSPDAIKAMCENKFIGGAELNHSGEWELSESAVASIRNLLNSVTDKNVSAKDLLSMILGLVHKLTNDVNALAGVVMSGNSREDRLPAEELSAGIREFCLSNPAKWDHDDALLFIKLLKGVDILNLLYMRNEMGIEKPWKYILDTSAAFVNHGKADLVKRVIKPLTMEVDRVVRHAITMEESMDDLSSAAEIREISGINVPVLAEMLMFMKSNKDEGQKRRTGSLKDPLEIKPG